MDHQRPREYNSYYRNITSDGAIKEPRSTISSRNKAAKRKATEEAIAIGNEDDIVARSISIK